MNVLLAKMRCSVVRLQKEMRRLSKMDKLPDEEAMVRQYMLAVYSQTRDKMVDFMVVDGTRKEDLTLKETMALMRKAEEAVSINVYDFEVMRDHQAKEIAVEETTDLGKEVAARVSRPEMLRQRRWTERSQLMRERIRCSGQM